MEDNSRKEFEQKKELQQKLHELLKKCKEKNINCAEKLGEFVDRAFLSKKDYSDWEDIISDIIDNM